MTNQPLTLDRLELYLLNLPQKSVFQSGIGTRKSKETLIVRWIDRDGREGYGECSCRPDPYYSAEFLGASKQLIEQFVAPKLKASQSYDEVLTILRQIRGWNFTRSAVESAMFQVARQMDTAYTLDQALAATPLAQVPVGISLGLYQDAGQFRSVVEEALDEGYQRIKFKISPWADTKLFDAINPLLFDRKIYVSFDANGSYRSTDMEKIEYFIKTYDTIIEQPTPPSRFGVFLRMKEHFPALKVCFDEEVENRGDLVKLHRLGVLDELNLKVGRVGGITNSIAMINYCHEHDIPCWIGGMFETGIGRLQNLELAAFLPQARAHDLSPSSRYFKEDIVAPEISMTNGHIEVAEARKAQVVQTQIDKFTTDKVVVKF